MKFKLNKDRLTTEGVLLIGGVIKNFAKFTGKHLCQSLFPDKFAGLRKYFDPPFTSLY